MKQLLHRPETREHVVIFSSQRSWRSYYSQNKNLKGQFYATTKFFFYGLSILGPEPAKLAKHCFFLLTKLKVCWSLEKIYSVRVQYMTLRISFANKTRKKNLPLLRVAGPCSSPIVMTKCRATCLLCKYHASKIDSSFHNWLNWGLALFQTHQHEVLTSVHGSAFSAFYSFYSYMDAKWRKLNATLTAQTNQNEVPPDSFFFLNIL